MNRGILMRFWMMMMFNYGSIYSEHEDVWEEKKPYSSRGNEASLEAGADVARMEKRKSRWSLETRRGNSCLGSQNKATSLKMALRLHQCLRCGNKL